jgi:hypothetical protein
MSRRADITLDKASCSSRGIAQPAGSADLSAALDVSPMVGTGRDQVRDIGSREYARLDGGGGLRVTVADTAMNRLRPR